MKSPKKLMIKSLEVVIYTFLIITLPGLIAICAEYMQIRDMVETKEWIVAHPYQMLLGYGVILLFFIMLYIIFCRLWVAMLGTSILFMLGAMINYYKVILRGDPFMPWDLMLKKEAGNILAHLNISIDVTTWFILIMLLLLIITMMLLKPQKLKWQYRLVGVTICLGIGTLFMQTTYLNQENLEKMAIEDIFWNQTRNYEINGFLTGFGINIKNAIIKAPSGYSQKNIHKIIDEYAEAQPVFSSNEFKREANIIMVMSEALWDPSLLTDIDYSTDPIPTINRIREEGASGWLLVPGYGGGTANTEFEVLTGHSMSFFPTGAMAYQQYIKEPLDSMASYLKGKGYTTIAIHPYQKWFWDRENVYPHLGFEAFISDEDFIDPHKRGPFISDMETSYEIIRQYEKNKGKPFFNYTVTMQNHGPYNDKRYGDDRIQVKGDNLSEASKDILETYTEGVKDSDDALRYLIEYFETVDEPTIIVMFGDHLPMLGDAYSVYKEANFVSEEVTSLEDTKNLHLTPLVVWNNYGNNKEDIGIINASYLGAYIMDYAKIEMPLYFKFLNRLHLTLPAYMKEVVVESDGSTSEFLPSEQEIIRQKHWMLQYDLMFGDQHSKDILYTY